MSEIDSKRHDCVSKISIVSLCGKETWIDSKRLDYVKNRFKDSSLCKKKNKTDSKRLDCVKNRFKEARLCKQNQYCFTVCKRDVDNYHIRSFG